MLAYVADAVPFACACGAALGCGYLALAFAVACGTSREAPSARPSAPVTILKPLHGAEPGLARRLRSFLTQDYAGPIQMVCGVMDRADPAIAEARSLGEAVTLCVDPTAHGANRKVSNLVNMVAHARHDVLVIADSDIEAEPDYLARVVAALEAPGVGAVTCLYHGVAAPGFWPALAALRIDAQFLPDALTALRFNLTQPCFGATIALRRDTLAAIGGMEAFANRLADDYAIGEAVRRLGLRVAVPRFTVGHVCFADGLADLFAQELRASRTVRCLAPLGHAGAAITHPFALALVAALRFGAPGLALAALALALRAALCWRVARAFGLARPRYALLPLRDLLSFAVFAASFFGAGVRWRGVAYRVDRRGDLAVRI